jgi:hypothetical protein
MWNWPKNSEHFKKELLSILEEMKEQENDIDAIEDLQYAISLSVIAVEQHCQNWVESVVVLVEDSSYQSTTEVFVKKVNQILSEERWSFE